MVKIHIFKNNREILDKYTIAIQEGKEISFFGMSESAVGFNQYLGDYPKYRLGKHLGKKVNFYSLSDKLRDAIADRLR